MNDTTTWHTVTKTPVTDYPGEFFYGWECPGPPHCTGFSECREPHIENGTNADEVTPFDGGDDQNPPPWDGLDEWTFHGVLHTYHDGYGWTVQDEGCVISETDLEVDDALLGEAPGRYAIDIAWENQEEPYIHDVRAVQLDGTCGAGCNQSHWELRA